jgi:hypothetical protein
MGLPSLHKEFWRRSAEISMKTKYPTPFRGGVPGDDFLTLQILHASPHSIARISKICSAAASPHMNTHILIQ